MMSVEADELARIAGGDHPDPHRVLGPHLHDGAVTVRVLRPFASEVLVRYGPDADRTLVPLAHEHGGIWVGELPVPEVPDYRLRVRYGDDPPIDADDPYRFAPTLGDLDLYLIGEGRHEQLWDVLGAHVRRRGSVPCSDGRPTDQARPGSGRSAGRSADRSDIQPDADDPGVSFAVWAPNARGVRVQADFNFWNSSGHPMRRLGGSGVWELFVPEAREGVRYRYEVLGRDGVWRQKSDPMAFFTETPPANASVVYASRYQWGDQEWLERRATQAAHRSPLSIYEVHLGSWRHGLTYRELADQLVPYVVEMGFTHVEFMPPMEHPFGGSWGYQVTSYYAPTSRFGTPDDFRFLIDTLHQHGIGVLLDWVPAHFPRDDWALARFDGSTLYEHGDVTRGEHPEWGTLIFDFGRSAVRNFLTANALYWLEQFHADGLRVDAVASMLYLDYSREASQWRPNMFGGRENLEAVSFLQEVNATCYKRVPGVVLIAEESTSWPGVTRPTHLGGLGFGFKWNMGWMNDSLSYLSHDPIHRQYHHGEMTFSMVYAFSENFVLPLSHDEVVHGKGSLLRKMPGDHWQQLANLRAYLAFMWAHPGKQLLFMGGEFGQEAEWSEARELEWWLLELPDHAGLRRLVGDLNRTYRSTSALWELDADPAGFWWIDANDAGNNVLSFVRSDASGRLLVCVTNFAAIPHHDYRLGLPRTGRWQELVNTDAEVYAGSGVGNLGVVTAVNEPWHGQPASSTLSLPPLGTLWLTPE